MGKTSKKLTLSETRSIPFNREGDAFVFAPFGHLVSDQNPFDAYIPPA